METIEKGKRHHYAHEKGGYRLQDPDGMIVDAGKELLKKIGGKLVKMQIFDLMKISAPVKLQYPMTYLESFMNDYTYFPKYMAQVVQIKDNIERLKLITTCFTAGLHVSQQILQAFSPINPILGETCQRVATSDGTKYFAEQITHHPPVTAAVMEGPDEKWRFEAIQEFKAHLNGHNSLKAYKDGVSVITLYDNTQYIIEGGVVNITGMVYGELVINFVGNILVKDITHNITAEIIFDPDNQEGYASWMASKMKFWGKKKEKRPSDHFDVIVYNEEEGKKKPLAAGKGSYLEYIEFDDEKYWEMGDDWDTWNPPEVNFLESDCSKREDIRLIKEKDYENAQKAKEELENNQRADKANRDKNRKE